MSGVDYSKWIGKKVVLTSGERDDVCVVRDLSVYSTQLGIYRIKTNMFINGSWWVDATHFRLATPYERFVNRRMTDAERLEYNRLRLEKGKPTIDGL